MRFCFVDLLDASEMVALFPYTSSAAGLLSALTFAEQPCEMLSYAHIDGKLNCFEPEKSELQHRSQYLPLLSWPFLLGNTGFVAFEKTCWYSLLQGYGDNYFVSSADSTVICTFLHRCCWTFHSIGS